MATEQTSIVVAPAPDMLARYGSDIVDAIVGKAEEYSGLTFDSRDNYESSNRVLRTVVTARTGIEKRRVELKAAPLKECNDIDAAAKYLTTLVEPIERQLKAKKDVVDQEKERIAAAKKAAKEAERVAKVKAAQAAEEERLAEIRAAEERRLEAIRVEQERIAAEQRAEAERLKEQQRAIDEANRKAAAELEERRLKVERAQQAERDRIAAERRQLEIDEANRLEEIRAAKAEAERIEAARLAKIQAEKGAAARLERDRIEAEERAVAEAERRAALEARRQALLPEKTKLAVWGEDLRQVLMNPPNVVDGDAKQVACRVQDAGLELVAELLGFGG